MCCNIVYSWYFILDSKRLFYLGPDWHGAARVLGPHRPNFPGENHQLYHLRLPVTRHDTNNWTNTFLNSFGVLSFLTVKRNDLFAVKLLYLLYKMSFCLITIKMKYDYRVYVFTKDGYCGLLYPWLGWLAKIMFVSMRWWWGPLCTRRTSLVGFL